MISYCPFVLFPLSAEDEILRSKKRLIIDNKLTSILYLSVYFSNFSLSPTGYFCSKSNQNVGISISPHP